jgi:hypothetical protein
MYTCDEVPEVTDGAQLHEILVAEPVIPLVHQRNGFALVHLRGQLDQLKMFLLYF